MTAFGLDETHGISKRPEVDVRADSRALNWTSAFASFQTERPYMDSFAAVPSTLVILHLDGYVKVDRWLAGHHAGRMIAPGGTFIMPGGTDFRVRLGGSLSTVHCYLHPHVLGSVARDMLRGDPDRLELVPRLGEGDPLLEPILLGLRAELLDPDAGCPGYVDHLARAAAARLIKAHSADAARLAPLPRMADTESPRRIARALDYIQAHLHRSISLDDLAEALAMSVSQVTALFKKRLDQPPHRVIMGLRVERARAMLAHGDLQIADIALACGFAHQEHMTRLFKRETSLTPALYRRSLH